jgi:hypothetical protein
MVQVFGSLAGGVGQIISVAKYMVKRRGPPSQRWRSFLRSHAADIAAMDLFVVPAGAPRSCLDQRRSKSNRAMDCTLEHVSIEGNRKIPKGSLIGESIGIDSILGGNDADGLFLRHSGTCHCTGGERGVATRSCGTV